MVSLSLDGLCVHSGEVNTHLTISFKDSSSKETSVWIFDGNLSQNTSLSPSHSLFQPPGNRIHCNAWCLQAPLPNLSNVSFHLIKNTSFYANESLECLNVNFRERKPTSGSNCIMSAHSFYLKVKCVIFDVKILYNIPSYYAKETK